MQLQSITIAGFRSFAEPVTVDLSGITLAAVTGPNHSGKSSLLRAIEYALYGPAHGEAASLVTRGRDTMQVSLTMVVGGQTHVVTRSHVKGTHKLMLTTNGEDAGARDLATTQQAIEELLGMDRTVARATWMAMQGDIESVALMDGPARRAVFVRALGLDAYDALHRRAKDERRTVSDTVEGLKGTLAGLQDAVQLNEALADLTDDQLAEAIACHERLRDLQQRRSVDDREATVLAEDVEATEAEAGDVEEARKALHEESMTLSEATDALTPAEDDLKDAKAALSSTEALLKTAHEQLEHAQDMQVGHCATCGQTLTKEARERVVALHTRSVESLTDEADTQRATVAEHQDTVNYLRQARDLAASAEQHARNRLHKAEDAERRLGELRKRYDAAQHRVQQHDKDIHDIEQQLTAWPHEVLVEEASLRRQQRAAESKAQQVRDDISAATARLEVLSALVAAYAPSGIPMAIMGDVALEVSAEANALLATMGSDLQVAIGTTKSTVDLTVGDAPWSSLSGQERFYVALALRLALGSAVARRTGHRVGTMLIDEGWGSLDPEHAQRAVQALAKLASTVSILTVTHVEDVGEQMPERLEVSADSGSSAVGRAA